MHPRAKASSAVGGKIARWTEAHARSCAKLGPDARLIACAPSSCGPTLARSVTVTATSACDLGGALKKAMIRKAYIQDRSRAFCLRIACGSAAPTHRSARVMRSSTSDIASRTFVIIMRTMQVFTSLQSRHG